MARRAVIVYEAKTESARKSVQNLSEEFVSLERRTRETEDVFGRMSQGAARSLQRVARAQDDVASSGVTMRSSVGAAANNLGFEMVQAAQDAQFGMAGVANQIPLMAEQFTQLQARTGSTKGAISALTSSLTGTAGLIGAVTILPTLIPSIVRFFSETEESADDAAEAMRDAVDAVSDFQGFEVAGLRIGPADVGPALQALRDRSDAIQREIQLRREQLQRRQQQRQAGQAGVGFGGAGAPVEGPSGREQALRGEINALQERNEQVTTFIERLKQQREEFQRQLDLRQTIRRATGLRPSGGGGAAESGAGGFVSRALTTGRFGGSAQQVLPGPFGQPGQVSQQMQRTLLAVNARQFGAEQVEQTAEQLPSVAEMRRKLGMLQDDTAGLADQFRGAIANTGVQAFTQLGVAIAGAQDAAEALKNSVASLAGSIGQLLLTQAIKGSLSGGFGFLGGGLALGSGLLQALDAGGRVNAPVQIVGETGPEIATLPQGSRVTSARDTSSVFGRLTREVQNMRSDLQRFGAEAARSRPVVFRDQMHSELADYDLENASRTGEALFRNDVTSA